MWQTIRDRAMVIKIMMMMMMMMMMMVTMKQ